MTPTRRPASSTVSSQAAEWKDGPTKRAWPSMAGRDGRLSWPTAHTIPSTTSVTSVPSPARTVNDHSRAVSSKRASVTSLRKRMHSPRPRSLAVAWR